MLNLRISGIIAGAAFILSLILGIVGGTTMPLLIVRPLLFACLFFIISGLVKLIVSRFLPEILENDEKDEVDNHPGSRINILEGDGRTGTGPRYAFSGALPDDSDHQLENITDLLAKTKASRVSSEGMDQNPQDDYTDDGDPEKIPELSPVDSRHGVSSAGKHAREPDIEGISGEEALPDLDSMAGAFLSPVEGEESDSTEYTVSASPPKSLYGSKSKAPAWSGDFNAKDLAAGLRTILSKEKEG